VTAILFPGVAQAKVIGNVSGFPFNLIWHFNNNSNGVWTAGQLSSLASNLGTNISGHIAKYSATNVVYTGIQTVDIGTQTPQEGAYSASIPGTATGTMEPANLCFCINFGITARYRGGHPRTYIPGQGAGAISTGNQWTSAALGTLAQDFANMIGATVSALATGGLAGVTHCVPRYTYEYTADNVHHKFTHTRTGPNGAPTVSTYTVQSRVCTQNRRLGAPIG
jgi:hypothetical protein